MPMIDLTLPAGVLSAEQRDTLAGELTRTLLEYEGAGRDNAIAAQIAWAYVDERDPATIYAAHVPAEQPRYRLLVTVPERALDDEKKAALVSAMTQRILEAEGTDPSDAAAAMRVWVLINEVPDGNWGGAGRIWRITDIARLVMKGEAPEGVEVPQPAATPG
jgi:phenylpyruvate tautomerase PptA (4-oxalocrotonate tautomerase family)